MTTPPLAAVSSPPSSERRYRALLDSLDEGYCVIEVLFDPGGLAIDFRFLEVNAAFEGHTGINAVIGRTMREIEPRHEDHWFETYGRVARTGRPERFVNFTRRPQERWYEVSAFPIDRSGSAHLGVLFADITERKKAESELFSSRQALRAVLDTIPQRVFWKDIDLTYLGCNRPFAQDMGYDSPDQVIGKSDYQATWAAAADVFRTDDRRVIDTATPKLNYEEVLPASDGRISWTRTNKVPLHGPDGRVIGVLGTYEDVTERKRAETRKTYLLGLSDALRPLDDPLAVQEAAARTLAGQLRADRVYYCEVDKSAGVIRIAREVIREGVPSLVGEYPLASFGWVAPALRTGQTMVVADVTVTPLLTDSDRSGLVALRVGSFVAVPLVRGGRLAALLCVTDVGPRDWADDEVELVWETAERTWSAVERARAEVAVHASEVRFRTLIETMPDGVMIHSGGRVTFCNAAGARLFGATGPAAVVGRVTSTLHSPTTLDGITRRATAARAAGRAGPGAEGEAIRLDGQAVPVHITALPVAIGDDDSVLVVFHDLTERRRVEAQLREQELMLREAAELAHVGGWNFDPATLKGDWTAETARIHGLDPSAPQDVANALTRFEGEDRARLEGALKAAIEYGTPYDLELTLHAASGETKRVRAICRPVIERGKVVRVRGSLQDVTELHALAERLRQSQKMDAFGQLAGGVAHDFNNLLQVINGYADLLLDRLPANDPSASLLMEIRKAGERSAALTRQLLAFARQQVSIPKVIDPSAAAVDTAGMLRRLIGEDIQLVTTLPAETWPVLIDPGQFEQVLLNLAVNARDAMPKGGTLTVATRNEIVADEAAGNQPGARPGPHTVLSVTDTGTGIAPEIMGRMFEPFFTTKGVGRGTGLGLATVYGIVQQAGGHVRVRSRVGVGSTFEVFLPRANGGPSAGTKSAIRMMPRGAETVLVVEDEAAVRGLVRTVLSARGYRVLEATDGSDAERVATNHAGPIHLVVSDVVMPGAGGREACAKIIARHPEARVLFMSGYTDDAVMRHGVSVADVRFLQKPFTPTALLAKVREVLDEPR